MKKKLILLIVITSAGCTAKPIYLTPNISGQVIDEVTKQPISEKGNIFTIVKEDLSNVAKTDENGFFHVLAYKSKPLAESIYRSRPSVLTFNIKGYQIKRMDYSGFKPIPEGKSRTVETKIDIGKIYLKPDTN